jgi:hypothetical protein
MKRRYGRRAGDLQVVRMRWSCNHHFAFAHHKHRWRWSAYVCAKRQWVIQILKELLS